MKGKQTRKMPERSTRSWTTALCRGCVERASAATAVNPEEGAKRIEVTRTDSDFGDKRGNLCSGEELQGR